MRVGAIVLAAGRGRRFGGPVSKQFAEVAGRPLVLHSVERFAAHPSIDDVWVVGGADELDQLAQSTQNLASQYLPGGAERSDSVEAAVREARGVFDRVLVHDAARPCVPADVVDRVVTALDAADAVATVVPVADTIVEVQGGAIARTPDRSTMFALQTPQGFSLPSLAAAFDERAEQVFTDDVSMVAALVPGARVVTVLGDPALHKVTTEADAVAIEAWLASGLM